MKSVQKRLGNRVRNKKNDKIPVKKEFFPKFGLDFLSELW